MDVSCIMAPRATHLFLLLVIFAVFFQVSVVEPLERGVCAPTDHHEVVDPHLLSICLVLVALPINLAVLVLVLLAQLQRDALLLGNCGLRVGPVRRLPAELLVLWAPVLMFRRLLAEEI